MYLLYDNLFLFCKAHMAECEFSMVQCTNNCGAEVQRNKLQHHTENECTRRIITCKHCELKVIFQRLNVSCMIQWMNNW